MDGFENSQFNRRSTDSIPPVCPCGKEMMALLQKIEGDIRDIKHGMGAIRTGFVRNDLGEPDYEGHRVAHLGMIEKAKAGNRAIEWLTLKIAGGVLGLLALIFMSGLGKWIVSLGGGA